MTVSKIPVVLFALGAVFAVGWWAGSQSEDSDQQQAEVAEVWTCPMHPQIRLPEPGSCPLCGMALVAADAGSEDGPREFSMSPADSKLAEIVTAPVESRFVSRRVRMVGKVDYDETRIETISAWIPGLSRLEKLYVDYTGLEVRLGDHLVLLYSPELLAAQTELLEAKKAAAVAGTGTDFLAESTRTAYASARAKLLLWGLSEEQLDEIEQRGSAEDRILIKSPSEGVVKLKALNQGDYVQAGTKIYEIAHLDDLWVLLDAYEQDLAWLRYGQEVELHTEAYPGEVFTGRISFIDWDVHEATRTVTVRVNVSNADRRLKPGMFVRAAVEASLAQGGRVMVPELSGKWICPMHPEVIEDESGACHICGMDLVTAEQAGYVTADDPTAKPLVVPASAVLVTGKRAVVYVEVPGRERPTFEGREVLLGPRTEEHYIILEGLEEGERVVVNGAFKIDSALQILAKPSMMSVGAEGEAQEAEATEPEIETFTGEEYEVFRSSLNPLREAYMSVQQALASDDPEGARTAVRRVGEALNAVESADLTGASSVAWHTEHAAIEQAVRSGEEAEEIGGLRQSFGDLSKSLIALERSFGHSGSAVHYEVFCSMAFDDLGASWLQLSDKIANPYFGADMLSCGEVEKQHSGLIGR